jgi:hypothetical protein
MGKSSIHSVEWRHGDRRARNCLLRGLHEEVQIVPVGCILGFGTKISGRWQIELLPRDFHAGVDKVGLN